MQAFLQALKKPDFYKDKIFKDPFILSIALAAVRNGDITPDQYGNLSQWIELRKFYGKKKIQIHPLFDQRGEFTREAKKYYLHYVLNVKEDFNKPLLRDENLEQFKTRLKQLPISSQVFITINIGTKGYTEGISFAYFAFPKTVLFGKDYGSSAFLPLSPYQCYIDTVFPPAAEELPSRAVIKARLGVITQEDIEMAHRAFEHPVPAYYPRPADEHIPSSSRYVHKWGTITTTEGGLHDLSHCLVLASINRKALCAEHLAADVIRNNMFNGDSKVRTYGLWAMADVVAISEGSSETVDAARVFSFLIMGIAYSEKEFLAEPAAAFLHIYFHPEKWSMYFNSQELYKNKYWDALKKYGTFFKSEDDVKFNIFKLCLIDEFSKSHKSDAEIQAALTDCNSAWKVNKENFLQNLEFSKHIKEFFNESKEINEERVYAYICWKGKMIATNNINEILQEVTSHVPEKKFSHMRVPRRKYEPSNDSLIYIFNNDLPAFKSIVESNRIDINQAINDQLKTFLHLAVRGNDFATTEFLLSHNADVNLKDTNGKSPLFYALLPRYSQVPEEERQHYKIAALLIRHGGEDEEGLKNVFNHFLPENDEEWETARLFIEHGADVTQSLLYDLESNTILDAAIAAGKSDIAALISSKLNISSNREQNSETSLKDQKNQIFFKPDKQIKEEEQQQEAAQNNPAPLSKNSTGHNPT